jgi:hypothetical protein
MKNSMPIAARRVLRLSLTMALSLVAAYGFAVPLPYVAPIFALLLTAAPTPPMGAKGLVGLIVVVLATLGIGLLVTPMLGNYPVSGVLVVGAGLYFSTYLTVNRGKGPVGTLLAVGYTLIPAAGTAAFSLALGVIHSLVSAIVIAIPCQWLVYPFLPEPPRTDVERPPVVTVRNSTWIAVRTALIVLPPFLLALSNPANYLPVIMKSVALGQQGSVVIARNAGRELLGSTALGGALAAAFWFALKLHPNLWMFFLWTLLFGVYVAAKLYRVAATRWPASFWQNTGVTMFILLGPAVEDSSAGADVEAAFVTRMTLFVAVTLYTCFMVYLLERVRERRTPRMDLARSVT